MKPRIYHMLIAIGFSGWMMSCGNSSGVNNATSEKNINSNKNQLSEKTDTNKNVQVLQDESKKEMVETKFDPSLFIADTTLYLNKYHIIIGKEKFDISKKEYTEDDLEFNPIVIYFTLTKNDSVVLKKKFEENSFASITSFPHTSTNYFTLVSFYGGSGYEATIYKIEFEEDPRFVEVASYNELSSTIFSKDGTELLIMDGIWDMSANGDEGHFSEHKYVINTIDLTNNKGKRTPSGTTSGKYPSMDLDFSSEKLLRQIHQTEP